MINGMGRAASRFAALFLACMLGGCAPPGGPSTVVPVEPAPPAVTAAIPAPEVPPPSFRPIPAQRQAGFPGVAFTEVRAFAFDLQVAERPVCRVPLDPDGTLCETVERPGVVLTEVQSRLVLAMLANESTWGEGASCFLPHHGLVFYDGATPVAQLSICFMCDVMVATPSIPKARSVGADNTYGLDETSTAKLRGLCRELGLPMCDATNPMEFAPAK